MAEIDSVEKKHELYTVIAKSLLSLVDFLERQSNGHLNY